MTDLFAFADEAATRARPTAPPAPAGADDDAERRAHDAFRAFHLANPHVYRLFRRFAERALSTGRARFGGRVIAERVRWEVDVETRDAESEFKLNNDYTPFYVRLFLHEFPQHEGRFELRTSFADTFPWTTLDQGAA